MRSWFLAVLALVIAGCGSQGENSSSHGGGSTNATTGVGGHGGGSSSGAGGCADTDPLFASGSLDKAAYKTLAGSLGTERGIAFRYGGAATCYHASPEKFATHCGPAHQSFAVQGSTTIEYELGSPNPNENDYSSTDGQVLCVAEAASEPGVEHFDMIQMTSGVFAESPQPMWQLGKVLADLAVTDPKGAAANGGPISGPVALSRAHGSGWNEDALTLFQSGLVAATGTYTGNTRLYFKLQSNQKPVAVALTNESEIALVLVWDTDAYKAQVLVVALGDGPAPGGMSFWGEWTETYPGLLNYGMFQFSKLLGAIDLPGMVAPTEISAASDFVLDDLGYAGWYDFPDGSAHASLQDLTLSVEANRQSFISGPNKGGYAKAGYAVVTSRAEGKVAFLDLTPLFTFLGGKYFGSPADFALTTKPGPAPDQWPYTFAHSPEATPTLTLTTTLADPPTAVSAPPTGGYALIATRDGTVHVYDVGALAGRHAAPGSASQPKPKEVDSLKVGQNPTSIAILKHGDDDWGATDVPKGGFVVVSRGDRRLDWVRLVGAMPVIDRTLQDSRLVDPIAAEDADNHGTLSYVVSVADYAKKQVANFRYGPVIFETNGGQRFDICSSGDFEFGGALAVPCKPFALSVSNTP